MPLHFGYSFFSAVRAAICLTLGIAGAFYPFSQTQAAEAATIPPKLAIISDDPSLSILSDLLTASFTQNEKVTLLERGQVAKILAEQKLQQAGLARDYLRTGQLMGADGVLVVELGKEGTNQQVQVRMVAVKPGAALGFLSAPWPNQDLPGWSKIAARRLEPLLPKLSILARDAIPLSIANLRASSSTAESMQMERELTLRLINRLLREPRFFVLERRKMETLILETELNRKAESDFWNGSYLVDGLIDPQSYSKETVTLNARLIPPGGKPPVQLNVAGKRSDPGQVIEILTGKILEALKLNSGVADWKPEEEAKYFAEEGYWALRWGLFPEARAAAESAWALGKKDQAAAALKVKAYLGELPTQPPFSRRATFEHLDGTVTRSFAFAFPPRLEHLRQLRTAIGAYQEFSISLGPEQPVFNSDWHQLGLSIFPKALAILEHFYLSPKWDEGSEVELRALRGDLRAVTEWISRSPTVQASLWLGNRSYQPGSPMLAGYENNIFASLVGNGRWWQESPEEMFQTYRRLVKADGFPFFRDSWWGVARANIAIVDWSQRKISEADQEWNRFLTQLSESPDFVESTEGYLAQMSRERDPKTFETLMDAFMGRVLTNRNFFQTNTGPRAFEASFDKLFQWRGERSQPLKARFISLYQKPLRQLEEAQSERAREAIREQTYLGGFQDVWKGQQDFFKAAPVDIFAAGSFRSIFGPQALAEIQQNIPEARFTNYLRDLETQLRAYKAKVPASEAKSESQLWSSILGLEKQIQTLSTNRLIETAGPKREPFRLLGMAGSAQISETNPLVVTRFIPIPARAFSFEKIDKIEVVDHRLFQDQFWLNLRFQVYSNARPFPPSPGLVGIDLKTFSSDHVLYPEGISARTSLFKEANQFAVTESGIFLVRPNDRFYQRKWNRREWEEIKLPLGGGTDIFEVHQRLFLGGTIAIFELINGGAEQQILAHARRRPPITRLDGNSFPNAMLFGGPKGQVRISQDLQVHAWNGEDWDFLTSTRHSDGHPTTLQIVSDTLISRPASQGSSEQLSVMPPNGTNLQLLLDIPSTMRSAVFNPAAKPSRWKAQGFSLKEAGIEFLNNDLLLLVPKVSHTNNHWTVTGKDGVHAELLYFQTNQSNPLRLPLRFAFLDSTNTYEGKPIWSQDSRNPFWMEFSPNWLIIGQRNLPGIALVEKEEVLNAFREQSEPLPQTTTRTEPQQIQGRTGSPRGFDGNEAVSSTDKGKLLSNPQYLATQWGAIDVNKTGFLDWGDNFSFFDANRNWRIEPEEEAAFTAVQWVVASNFFLKHDANSDQRLSPEELKSAFELARYNQIALPAVLQNQEREISPVDFRSLALEITKNSLPRVSIGTSAGIKELGFLEKIEKFLRDGAMSRSSGVRGTGPSRSGPNPGNSPPGVSQSPGPTRP